MPDLTDSLHIQGQSMNTPLFIISVFVALSGGAALVAISRTGRAETRINGRLVNLEQRLDRFMTEVEGIRDEMNGNMRHVLRQNDEMAKHIVRFEEDALELQRTIKDVRNIFQEPRLDRAVLARILERLETLERRIQGS